MNRPIERLVDTGHVTRVDAKGIDRFVASGPCLLFFTGDVDLRAETRDVAVVLRELLGKYGARLRVGLVARADEDELARRFGATVMPSVVEVTGGVGRAVVPRVQPWAAYASVAARVAEGGA